MVYETIFPIFAALEITAILLIFIFKSLLHSVLALATVFFANSLLFLILDQPLLALLQLFIMVGGVSTYIFVGVASGSYSHFKHTSYKALVALSVLSFILLFYKTTTMSFAPQQNLLSQESIASMLTSNIGILYIVTFMLFGVGFGSIILLKKISGRK